jgi:hypothetical protein
VFLSFVAANVRFDHGGPALFSASRSRVTGPSPASRGCSA